MRRKGGGGKPLSETDPTVVDDLRRLVEPATLGSPVQPLRWVSKSREKLAAALSEMGHKISANTVGKLLTTVLGFSRQVNRKADEGSHHRRAVQAPRQLRRRAAGEEGRPRKAASHAVAGPGTEDSSDRPLTDAERMEIARLARMAGQAKESGVFFRLQLKPAPKEPKTTDVRVEPVPKTAPVETDGGLATLSALRAADRALALAGGDTDLIGVSINMADQTRKLTFLRAGPDRQVYNPHGLRTPVSAYQLMAGTVIAASLITGLSSDLPGFVIAQVTEHVYDTVSGRFLLVPQGLRLIGK